MKSLGFFEATLAVVFEAIRTGSVFIILITRKPLFASRTKFPIAGNTGSVSRFVMFFKASGLHLFRACFSGLRCPSATDSFGVGFPVASSFPFGHIRKVLFLVCKIKMSRIYARWVVAMMANVQAFWNFAYKKLIHQPMYANILSFIEGFPVVCVALCACPDPTTVLIDSDFLHKPFKCFHGFSITQKGLKCQVCAT